MEKGKTPDEFLRNEGIGIGRNVTRDTVETLLKDFRNESLPHFDKMQTALKSIHEEVLSIYSSIDHNYQMSESAKEQYLIQLRRTMALIVNVADV